MPDRSRPTAAAARDVAVAAPARTDRRALASELRARHPELSVGDPVWTPAGRGGSWRWAVELSDGPKFTSEVAFDCGEPAQVAPALSVGRVLALVDALSYWKAAVPAVMRCDFPLAGSADWWNRLMAGSMAEFLWVNGLDPSWLPVLDAAGSDDLDGDSGDPSQAVLLHSGGKDSIAAGRLLSASGHRIRPLTYQPTAEALAVVAGSAPPEGWLGEGATIRRVLDRRLLDLNRAGYLNGHTPFSAWLAVAAVAVAEMTGSGRVAAGNAASDDEPNITGSWRGRPWPVNHQWSKSAEFESAWAALGAGRRYASPLRPMLELAVIAGLVATASAGWDRALSCNRSAQAGRPGAWCGRCPKCLWTALALAALSGREAAVARMGADPLDDLDNAGLVASMCGRRGPVPFECGGLPLEVRACVRSVLTEDAPGVAALSLLDEADIEDGPEPPEVADLVARVGPAPLLAPPEMEAVCQWVDRARAITGTPSS